MHRTVAVFVVLILPFVAFAAPHADPAKLTAEQREKLKERDRLRREANALLSAGKPAESRATFAECLALEIAVFGDSDLELVPTLETLASLSVHLEDHGGAREYARKALSVITKNLGETHWKTIDASLTAVDIDFIFKLTKEQKASVLAAGRLFQESQRLKKAGELKKAVDAAEKALGIRLSIYGEKHTVLGHTRSWLGDLHESLREYEAAEKEYERARAIFQEILGVRHPTYARALEDLAYLLKSRGIYDRAETLYLEAAAIYKEVLGIDHLKYADSLNNFVFLYAGQGLYQKAEIACLELLAVTEKYRGVGHPVYSRGLNNLAQLYYSQGLYSRAEPLFLKAIQLRKELLGVKHPAYATSLNNLAALYKATGAYIKAERLYLESLEIYKVVYGIKHPDYAVALNNLADLDVAQGKFARAEPRYQEALAIRREVFGSNHPEFADSLNNLATLYMMQGQLATAEPLLKQTLGIYKSIKHRNYPHSLNNLAVLYKLQGRFGPAEALYKEALELYKSTVGVKSLEYALGLNNLAAIYKEQRLYSKAESHYQEVLEVRKELLGDKHPVYASSLNNLAGLYYTQERYREGEGLYIQALSILKESIGTRNLTYSLTQNNLALVYMALGMDAKAEPLAREAIIFIEDHLEETASIESEASQLTYLAESRFYLDTLLGIKGTRAEDVYAIANRWRGAVSARQTFARASRHADGNVAELVESLRDIAKQQCDLVNNPRQESGKDIDVIRRKLETERDRLEKQLALSSKAFAKYQTYRTHSTADLQKLLPDKAVIVDFIAHGDQIAAFVISAKKIVRVELTGGGALAEEVIEFRKPLSLGRTRPVQGEFDESRLYQLVWAPLVPHLGNAELILICPDGPLCQVPFAALRGKDPKKYLIEEMAIAILPVPRMLPELLDRSRTTAPGTSLLAVGDVDFDASRQERAGPKPALGTHWEQLPATRSEILALEKVFHEAVPRGLFTSLSGHRATNNAVRTEAAKFTHLHFATHGYFATESPRIDPIRPETQSPAGPNPNLLCGLVFAGANRPGPDESGLMTALEIMDLDLAKVDLAVLSACETGLGRIENGDGVLGLQRAFLLAGTRSTVTSLWQVPDQATSTLMIRFYENSLKKGMPTLEALREAQLWMLNHPVEAGIFPQQLRNGRRTPPLYWAAFSLAGDWR